MYANLSVRTRERPRGAWSTPVCAWKVEIVGQRANIYLDKQNGEGSYAEPAGLKFVSLRTHTVEIVADF